MKKALLDTNILIDYLRGNQSAVHFLSNLIIEKVKVYCSVITRIELMTGMRAKEEESILKFVEIFEEINIEKNIANVAGYYMNKYASGSGLVTADAIIAASANNINAVLYTLNIKHFPMDDIDIQKPY